MNLLAWDEIDGPAGHAVVLYAAVDPADMHTFGGYISADVWADATPEQRIRLTAYLRDEAYGRYEAWRRDTGGA